MNILSELYDINIIKNLVSLDALYCQLTVLHTVQLSICYYDKNMGFKLTNLLFLTFLISFYNLFSQNNHKNSASHLRNTYFYHNHAGMHLAPNMSKAYINLAKYFKLPKMDQKNNEDSKKLIDPFDNVFSNRWGFNVHNNKIVGFFNHTEAQHQYEIGVLSCVACHSGYADGQFIVGLGNKNIDVGKTADDLKTALTMWSFLNKSNNPLHKEITQKSKSFAQRLSNSKFNNLTQGLVPVSMIREWFYRIKKLPIPQDMRRAQVKVPHFWGYGQKRKIGQFTDGYGNGIHAGWGLAVELSGGQSNNSIHQLMPKVEKLEKALEHIQAPPYKRHINIIQANSGKVVYKNYCYQCHGSYSKDQNNFNVYKKPQFIDHEDIKTDEDRILGNTDEFNKLVDNNPLNKYIKRNNLGYGYFAPRLEGIWARFPYLHNSSVPTIYDLLSEPQKRPQYWSLERAGSKNRFDPTFLGLKIERNSKLKKFFIKNKANEAQRNHYSTKRIGHSNQGHWFSFSKELTHQDKMNLIEYLKTL